MGWLALLLNERSFHLRRRRPAFNDPQHTVYKLIAHIREKQHARAKSQFEALRREAAAVTPRPTQFCELVQLLPRPLVYFRRGPSRRLVVKRGASERTVSRIRNTRKKYKN